MVACVAEYYTANEGVRHVRIAIGKTVARETPSIISVAMRPKQKPPRTVRPHRAVQTRPQGGLDQEDTGIGDSTGFSKSQTRHADLDIEPIHSYWTLLPHENIHPAR